MIIRPLFCIGAALCIAFALIAATGSSPAGLTLADWCTGAVAFASLALSASRIRFGGRARG